MFSEERAPTPTGALPSIYFNEVVEVAAVEMLYSDVDSEAVVAFSRSTEIEELLVVACAT